MTKRKTAYQMANEKAVNSLGTLVKVVEKHTKKPKACDDFEMALVGQMKRDLAGLVFTSDSGQDYEVAKLIQMLAIKSQYAEEALLNSITDIAKLEVDVEVLEEENKWLKEKILKKGLR